MAKLFVICGHGAGDSGAVGNGFKEAEQVRKLGKKIKELGGSNVMLGDVSRNFYKDKGILNLTIPKDYKIIELHMDSGVKTAKGAHVIIKKGFKADDYDNALAKFIGDMFPGRSSKIVGRSDLANVNRAATKGYNYRLVECGFISNPDDAKKFNSNIDEIAKGILEAFGIRTWNSNVSNLKPQKLTADGEWGVRTTEVTQFVLGTEQDGIVSGQPKENREYLLNVKTDSWRFYDDYKNRGGSSMVEAIQRLVGTTVDGWCGEGTITAMQKFLNKRGFFEGNYDGLLGVKTVTGWQKYINSRI